MTRTLTVVCPVYNEEEVIASFHAAPSVLTSASKRSSFWHSAHWQPLPSSESHTMTSRTPGICPRSAIQPPTTLTISGREKHMTARTG